MGKTDSNVTVVWNKSDAAVDLGNIQPVTIHGANAAVLLGRIEQRAAV
jgi:hypothetical protein